MDKSLQVVLVHILTHIGLIFFIFPTNIIDSTESAQWIPILLGFLLHWILISLYTKGLSQFESQNLLDIYSQFGKPVAVIFLLPLFIYMFMVISVTIRAYAETISLVFLSNTPLWAIMLLTLLISAYITSLGVQALFRTGVLMALIFFPLIVFVLCMSFQNVDWHYIFPLWNSRFSFLTDPDYLESSFAFFGGFMYLGFIQPKVLYNRKKVIWGSLLLLPFFLIAVYIPVLTFGENTTSQYHFPFIVAVDTIDITWLMFDRITMFFLLCTVTFVMLFTALTAWVNVEILRRCLPKSIRTSYIVIGLTLLTFIMGINIPDWQDVDLLFGLNAWMRLYVYLTIPSSIFILGWISRRKEATAA
ncbi:GerAB/ArcD/ProY family transporter [Paenibacillus sp. DXFW5]|uniref:GerAB/ArcD/ProY family transporter n=1 Tax=Paenibacillus rhizolycopersici TaxID=2780073 RepID=A0ABS2H1D6_9BACL|nr:GerAB/ArcD/ProY family transporter [Paenibacillus rhizolycopersici]MBM6994518.1 GerAB/ArcD/ProY family transporter [Paenibacillus rhizolycopersici]